MNKLMAEDRAKQPEILDKVVEEARRFLEYRKEGPAYPYWERQPLRCMGEHGLGAEGAMEMFISQYGKGLALNSGSRFFGFVIGGVTPAALAGDWMSSLYDQNAFGEMDCMDRQIEDEAVEFLKDMLGLRKDFTGSFTSGATMASTNALACAREWAAAKQGKTANDGVYGLERPVVLSASAHASIYKGLSVLGLGRNCVTEYGKLPGRDCGDVEKLEGQLKKAKGKSVIVIANMGTANSGDMDDLKAIAELKKRYGFWLHIDGAVGAMAMASPEYRHLFDGAEEADSLTIDGHKWLNVNYDCAIAMIRKEHRELQYRAYAQSACVSDCWTENTALDHLGGEGSRRLRALPVWMSLMAYGKEGFREMVERNCRMAWLFAEKLKASGVFKVHEPLLINGFAFTLNKENLSKEEIHALEAEIRKEGTTYLNPADVCGTAHLRCSLSNWAIEEADVERVAEAVIACGRKFIG